jgi:outer membrane protein assembly factor BamB
MKKKLLLTIALSFTMLLGAQAQFGKLKGLIKKDKTEETKSDDKGTAGGDDAVATSTEGIAANPKAWTADFNKNIDWFKLNPTGKLIVGASDGVYGIDAATGKTIWKLADFKDIGKDNFNAIPNSPYVAIMLGGMTSYYHVIVDATDGRVVTDTKAMGMKYVGKRYVVPSLGGILFAGYIDNVQSLVMIEASTGKKIWTLQNVFESNKESLAARPLAVDGQNIMLATNLRVYKINTATGALAWKANIETIMDKGTLATEPEEVSQDKESTKVDEPKGGIAGKLGGFGGLGNLTKSNGAGNGLAKFMDMTYGKFLLVDKTPGVVYYYGPTIIAAYEIASGKAIWGPVKLSDPIFSLIQDERGFLITTNDKNSDLLLLDYATGQQKWSPVKLAGKASAIKLNGDKLAVASAKESGSNSVNIIDINTGKPLASSALKVSGVIQDIRMTDKGLIYRTSKETNIQDINSGKDLWSSSLSYKEGTGLGIDKDGKSYIWGNHKLYVLDHKDGQYKEIGGVKFGGDETANNIELRDKGILVSSSQNVALFDFEGNKIFHVYQSAPGISTFGKIMSVAVMSASLAQSASHGFNAGYAGTNTSYGQNQMAAADRWSNLGSAAANDMSRRFTASQGAGSYQVILTKVTTGSDSGVGLVRVNKDTGKIEAKVVLDDKKPDYLADETDNLVFYKSGNSQLTGFHL